MDWDATSGLDVDICKACGKPILIAIFKNGDWCSDDCRKELINRGIASKGPDVPSLWLN